MFGLSISFHEMAAGSLGVLTKKTKSLLLRIRNAGAFSISAIVPLPPLSASAFKARHVPRKTVGARPKETGPSESRRSVAVVVQLFRADGLAATRRSLRAESAQLPHPGPESPIRCWSVNLRSWRRHGEHLLSPALAQNVLVVAVQEQGLPEDELGAAARACRQTVTWLPFRKHPG